MKSEGDLRMRYGDSINWKKIKSKDKIYSQSYLFTGPNSSATYAFLDESSINLGENSLIFMDFVTEPSKRSKGDDSLSLELVEGEMQINLKEKSPIKKIKVEDAIIDISKDQKTIIQLNYEQKEGLDIAVIQGDIDIKQKNISYNVKQGEKVGITNNDVVPRPETIDQKTMDEIKRLAELDHQHTVEDLKKRRQLLNILHTLIDSLTGGSSDK